MKLITLVFVVLVIIASVLWASYALRKNVDKRQAAKMATCTCERTGQTNATIKMCRMTGLCPKVSEEEQAVIDNSSY